MDDRANAYARHQQARWLRPDAARWVRPDAAKFLKPGTRPADVYPAAVRFDATDARLDREIADAIAHERSVLATLRNELAEINADLTRREAERKYSDSQPRVPAGNGRQSGRWTEGGVAIGENGVPRVYIGGRDAESGETGVGGSDASSPMGSIDFGDVSDEAGPLDLFDITPRERRTDGVRLAENNDSNRPLIDLAEEDQQGGHAISKHVNRSNEYLKARVRDEAARAHSQGDYFSGVGVGSFVSLQ